MFVVAGDINGNSNLGYIRILDRFVYGCRNADESRFVRTLYNLVVKVGCLKFWHKPHLWLGGTEGTSPELGGGYNVPPCPHSSDATESNTVVRTIGNYLINFVILTDKTTTANWSAVSADCLNVWHFVYPKTLWHRCLCCSQYCALYVCMCVCACE